LNARRRAILIACLRRTDRGDPLDSILRDYHDEGDWLRQHLCLSNELTLTCRPSQEATNRTQQLILNAPSRLDRPAAAATRLRFAVTMAQSAIIIVGCLTLTAGAAVASGASLRSVPSDVVETLLEPLPPLADNLPGSLVLGPEGEAAAEASSDSERADGQSGVDSAVKDNAEAILGVSGGTVATDASAPVQGDPPSNANPSGNDTPNSNPPATGNEGSPPGNDGDDPPGWENRGGDHDNQPGTTNAAGQNPAHDGQRGSQLRNSSSSAGSQGGNPQSQTDPHGNESNGEQSNGSNRASDGTNGGGSSDHDNGGPSGSKPGHVSAVGKSGPT
jgi:hypothetical protein